MKHSALRQRIREYEDAYRITLPRRTPIIIRVDGKAFHTLTRSLDRPWDSYFTSIMNATAKALLNEIQGSQIAYVQSDEITLFVRNYDNYNTSPWFGNVLQKMCSLAASTATMAFNEYVNNNRIEKYIKPAMFDARVFCVPREEVCNVFIDRQEDCIRNSILNVGQHFLGHKQIQGLNCSEIKDKLNLMGSQSITKDGIVIGEGGWGNFNSHQKYGRIAMKIKTVRRASFTEASIMPTGDISLGGVVQELRNDPIILPSTPLFKEDRKLIDKLVWPTYEEGRYSEYVREK